MRDFPQRSLTATCAADRTTESRRKVLHKARRRTGEACDAECLAERRGYLSGGLAAVRWSAKRLVRAVLESGQFYGKSMRCESRVLDRSLIGQTLFMPFKLKPIAGYSLGVALGVQSRMHFMLLPIRKAESAESGLRGRDVK
jgi:hypothetical protein